MQAVVPAAGEGTRMRPLAGDRPKGLVEVGGRPLLTHVFGALSGLGIEELVVVIGYRGDAIVEHYGGSFEDVPITYVRQEERRGLAHALLRAERRVEGAFVLANGDNVFRANLDAAVARHRDRDPDATVLAETLPAAKARETGVFELDGDGDPTGLVEKPDDPPSTLATTGFYVLSPAVFRACHLLTPSERGEYELTDAIDLLLYAGRPVEVVRLEGWRVNVNTPADVEAVERRLGADGT